jgi:hypothetical protein
MQVVSQTVQLDTIKMKPLFHVRYACQAVTLVHQGLLAPRAVQDAFILEIV